MVHVAILGFGTVGSGVAEVLTQNMEKISLSAAESISLKYILECRDCPDSPFADRIVRDIGQILDDPQIRVVIETIGGVDAAYAYTKRALLAGKSVVTSNKELVATHGHELISIARTNNLNYLFEASVGGGIPIIRPLSQCLVANELSEIYGILNGTTNYILSQMATNGSSFDAALNTAKEKGYAELDPADDINGEDARRKICILAALGFGRHIHPEQVPTVGISDITLDDVSIAQAAGYKIKLLGRAIRLESGKIAAYVAPHLIPNGSLLANVEGVYNGIVVRGNVIGEVMFCGRGAGKLPTASAVVADVIDCVKHFHARKYIDWDEGTPESITAPHSLKHRWYVRTNAHNAHLFAQSKTLAYSPKGQAAFFTETMSEAEITPILHTAGVRTAFRVLA